MFPLVMPQPSELVNKAGITIGSRPAVGYVTANSPSDGSKRRFTVLRVKYLLLSGKSVTIFYVQTFSEKVLGNLFLISFSHGYTCLLDDMRFNLYVA